MSIPGEKNPFYRTEGGRGAPRGGGGKKRNRQPDPVYLYKLVNREIRKKGVSIVRSPRRTSSAEEEEGQSDGP